MLRKLFPVLSCLLITTALSAQVVPSAEGGATAGTFWVGGSYSRFNPDYGCPQASPFSCGAGMSLLAGPTLYADTNHLFLLRRMGVAGETRFLSMSGPDKGLSETSYLAGPKYRLLRFKNLDFNSKLPLGFGHISLPNHELGSGNYFVYAPGAAVDYRVARRVSARAEYEYQLWPGFKGVKTSFTTGTGGITPNGMSFGVNYAIR